MSQINEEIPIQATDEDGRFVWYLGDRLHRVDGPAREDTMFGVKEWFFLDHPHRMDGPAYEDELGYREWWIHGREFSQRTFSIIIAATRRSGHSVDTVIRFHDELRVPEESLARVLGHMLKFPRHWDVITCPQEPAPLT